MKLLSLLIIALGAFILSGCVSLPPESSVPVSNTKHTIYFIYRGWHTSVLLDAKLMAKRNPQLARELAGQKYARIGWGDGDYFTGKSKSAMTAAKALVASGYSAVQLLTYDVDPFAEIPADTIVPLAITDDGMTKLTAYLGGSIAVSSSGSLIRLPAYGDAMGYFYQSRDRYGVFSNCNTWSGKALRAAGLPVANRLTARGVFEQAQYISRLQNERGLFKTGR